jgi:hypothetical protein
MVWHKVMWHAPWIFINIFSMEKDDVTWDDVTYLNVERIKINDL